MIDSKEGGQKEKRESYQVTIEQRSESHRMGKKIRWRGQRLQAQREKPMKSDGFNRRRRGGLELRCERGSGDLLGCGGTLEKG